MRRGTGYPPLYSTLLADRPARRGRPGARGVRPGPAPNELPIATYWLPAGIDAIGSSSVPINRVSMITVTF